MGDDITIGVTEIVNNIEVTAQPNDQIVDISVIDNTDEVTLNITPTVIEINVNKGSSYAKWGTILGTLSDQTDLQDALDLKADLIDGLVPSYQLPSYVDDVIEVANYAALPASGETGKIYITLDTNRIYRWSGSTYIEITDNTAVWGAITGTLSSQTDLVNALNLRVPYTGATSNVNLGEYGLTGGFLALDTTPTSTPTGIGTIYWDSANRTAALIDGDGDTTLQIGQEQRILVHNNTGSTLTDGQVVYVTGSTGELPSVSLADASSEITSGATIGMITESIANGADGFVTTSGIIHGLNTLAFNEGDLLWLGTTAGTYTATKPSSPNHLVLIGYVIKKAGGNGSILVKIQNTQELDECSDVLFTGLSNNNILTWESATSLWKNKSIISILGYNPANAATTISTTAPLSGGGDISSNRTLSISQANSTTNGYLSSTDWNTFNNKQNALTNPITGTGAANYLPKFTGSTALGNSLIYEIGSTIGIGTTSPFSALHISRNASELLRITRGSVSDFSFDLGASNDLYIKNNGVGTTPLTILGSGNVGIGTTSPSAKFHISNGGAAGIEFDATGGSLGGGYIQSFNRSTNVFSNLDVYANTIAFQTGSGSGSTERMRITSGGDVFIGATSAANVEKLGVTYDSQSRLGLVLNDTYTGGGIAQIAINFRRNGSAVGSITTTTTTTSYNVTSDYRLKEDFKDYSGIDLISKIKTYDYKWKGCYDRSYGVKAHELQEVIPYAVTGEKDAEQMQSVDYSKLVPILVQAIQELKQEIDLLKQK
jgi:hypothetical protein